MNMDRGKTIALVFMTCHNSIIKLLSGWYGIFGTAPNWVRSYILNRVQRVKLLNKVGEPFKTDYGVP